MSDRGRILIVEDRDSLRRLMEHALVEEGYRVTAAASVAQGARELERGAFDLVLTDLKLPDGSGLSVLETCRERHPELPVVVLTAFGTVATAVDAMKLGASDFLEKPLELDDLFELVRAYVNREAAAPVFQAPGAPAIVGRHPRLKAALRLLRKVAPTESMVLLTGESGTGKELFARALHALSPRRDGPFVAVNCAAIPEALMENELFGHEKGAFTGADRRQPGRFELAQGGTLFLDEIGELRLEMQGKVLRVLEERTFERVGGGRPLRSDARVVAATNRDLSAMAAEGAFRRDLYYRLEVFPIELPALRERPSDVPDLARHLVREIGGRLGQAPRELSADALEHLRRARWPGNVRQLANCLERALILGEGPTITARDLESLDLARPEGGEREAIRRALAATGGDKRRAAERLGTSYRTLQRKIRRYDLEGYPKYRE